MREVDFKRSIKKYFIDNLVTTEELFVSFDMLYDVPLDGSGNKRNSWIVFSFENKNLGTVSEQLIRVDLFTRKDAEGDNLSALLDVFLSYIYNELSTNGYHSIPYYDTSSSPWSLVGGIVPFVKQILPEYDAKDKTKIRGIDLLCKWGGK